MKTVYICSEYFAPFQNIGSVKFTKIAKYLSRDSEYKIIVFSRKNFNKIDLLLDDDLREIKKNGGKIFYIDAGSGYYKQSDVYKIFRKVLNRLGGCSISYYISNTKSANIFCRNAMQVIKNNNLPKPDYIISTYDDWGGHYLAMHLKKQLKDNVVWISDFRDPVGSVIKKGIFRKLCDDYTYSVTEKSDYTTLTSNELLHDIKMHTNTKYLVATNGFDDEDYKRVLLDKQKLHFVYTGSFYHQKQTLLPVFQAIRELIDEKEIEERFITIEYAGVYNEKVYCEICKFGLEKCYFNWGEVSRYQSILLQERADILMTSVWNLDDYKGVLAGKTLGYLMLNRPIIAVVSGNLANSEMKRFVEETNCGICYEEASHETDYDCLKSKIKDFYDQKRKQGKVIIKYSDEAEKYNYKNITQLYKKIMDKSKD